LKVFLSLPLFAVADLRKVAQLGGSEQLTAALGARRDHQDVERLGDRRASPGGTFQ
jgi:hypothetical protein